MIELRDHPAHDMPRIGGRYQPSRRLGDGAYGVVLQCWDPVDEHWVAVKLLRDALATERSARMRFADEVELMRTLVNPHVVSVLAADLGGQVPYVVTELVRGGSLAGWLDEHGPLSPRLACEVVHQIASGLGAAHDLGLVHGDVRPSHVLLVGDGMCKLTGFLGRRAGDSEGVQVDVHGLGTTLFELLTGRGAASPSEVRAARPVLEALHPALATVVLQACDRDTAEFADTDALAQALLAHMLDLPPSDGATLDLPLEPLPDGPAQVVSSDLAEALGRLLGPMSVPSPEVQIEAVIASGTDEGDAPAAKPPDLATQQARRRYTLAATAAFTLSLAALLLTVVASASVVAKGSALRTARAELLQAQPKLIEAVAEEHDLLERIAAAGGDSPELHEAWKAFEEAKEPWTRGDAAADVVDVMEVGVGWAQSDPRGEGSRFDLVEDLAPLRRLRDERRHAEEVWTSAARHPQGRLAIRLGLGEAPAR